MPEGISFEMTPFSVKKLMTGEEVEDFIRDDSRNGNVTFFMYNTPAISMHEPKGVRKMYVLQIDDCDHRIFARNDDEKNGDRNSDTDGREQEKDESNDDLFGVKKRRSRVTYSPVELSILEENFSAMLQRGSGVYLEVVKKLNLHRPHSKLSVRHVKNWISNKKQKLNRIK